MPSIFSLETELTIMFINKQHEIKKLTNNQTTEFIEKQKQDLEQFKAKLEEYKILKENIVYMDNAYDITKLNPCTFNFINNPQKKIGFIAQDVQKIIPDSVTINPMEKTLTIDYSAILSASIDSIKQIIKKMEILSTKIEKIEENIIRIDGTIEKIEEKINM
jgi:DNA repair ATPase RecN